MTPTTPAPPRRDRSAHATIRGYLYQTCLGVLRWVDLEPGEVLVCEGDEDLDRHILGGGSIFEQVKAYSGGLGLADRAVVESLRQFLRSYATLQPEGRERRFLFTTTAYRRRSRKGGLDFDLLKAWQEGDRRPEVCAAIRSIVLGDELPPEWLAEAVAWLDAEPEGWKGFLDAVEWTFEAPDLDRVRSEIVRSKTCSRGLSHRGRSHPSSRTPKSAARRATPRRSSRLSATQAAPKGRKHRAWGVSPRNRATYPHSAPKGRQQTAALLLRDDVMDRLPAIVCCRPCRARGSWGVFFLGLTPQALCCRPFGAGSVRQLGWD